MQYWLMKSEPETFSIDDLIKQPKKTFHWEGIRNYQARNFMRDHMQVGDLAFFYHSNCTPPGIVGVMEIVKAAYPDYFAWDKQSKYFDPKSTPENPRWIMVDVCFVEKFKKMITLDELKQQQKLSHMRVLQRGNRLSITPVSETEWKYIMNLAS